MVRAKNLLVFSAIALSLALPTTAQAQQGGANSGRADSGCIRVVKALSWIAALISGNDDQCKTSRTEDSLSSRSEHGRGANSNRATASGSRQVS